MSRVAGWLPALMVAVAVSACGLGGSGSPAIQLDGSSTVFPISEAVAEEFQLSGHDAHVTVGISGTGGGFELFCRGDIDIANASRPIRDSELADCAEEGITDIVEFQVAVDALAVVVSPENDFATCMTLDELYEAFRLDGAETWAGINAAWPDEDLELYFPGTDSGTFDYFNEAVIRGVGGEEAAHRGDGTASEDDNVLAIGVTGDRYALGYFGFAAYQGADDIRAVRLDAGSGCIPPTAETANSGSYPLSRPLFVYTRESLLRDRPEILDFMRFYLESTNVVSPEVGYIALPEEVLAEQFAKLP
jgi:phosphate transport system substrate-binding protein